MILPMIRQEIDNILEHPYAKLVITGAVIALSGLSGWYFYQRSLSTKNVQAYQLLSNVMHEFDSASQAQASWEDVAVLADIGYRRNNKNWSSLYFSIIQAYALEQEDKKQESILLWNDIMHNCPKSHPLWYLFSTKHTALSLESSDSSIQLKAVEQLHILAYEPNNNYRDQALYYLGFFEPSAWDTLYKEFGSTNSTWAALRNSTTLGH